MHIWRHLAIAILLTTSSIPGSAGEPARVNECADTTGTSRPAEAFAAFCGRCHEPQALADAYFAAGKSDTPAEREAELSAYLDRHSACPHRHHEEIAAWLRQLAPAP
jgi:cytochrome c553